MSFVKRKQGRQVSMRKIREVLRLGMVCGLGLREIGRSCNLSHPTAKKYLTAIKEAGISWQEIEKLNDRQIYQLVRKVDLEKVKILRPMPDYAYIHQELKKRSVTLDLLWQEYKEVNPSGYQYSQFRNHYYEFKQRLNISLRQTYKAGEKMFVDYAGQTVPIHDRSNGTIKEAQIFVGVLGASNYTYAQASLSQSIPAWINSHINAFEYFGGVAEIIICDNLKAGVTSPCRYEPDINPTYYDMAAHYNTVIIPGRVRRPKDKAKVENAVLVVERWILAALRNRKFFSLEELNQAIKELLIKLNQRPFKKLIGSREFLFKQLDQPALKALPEKSYEFASWKKATVNIDYHVELQGNYYSVPYQLIHQKVDIRYNENTVEIFHNNSRITSHKYSAKRSWYSTIKEHMPKSHQQYLEWTPSRILEIASGIGQNTKTVANNILASRQYPELGYRSCLGIIRLAKQYSQSRVEAACQKAIAIGACSYKSIRSILEKGLESKELSVSKDLIINHANVRGNIYFINNQ